MKISVLTQDFSAFVLCFADFNHMHADNFSSYDYNWDDHHDHRHQRVMRNRLKKSHYTPYLYRT